MRTVVFTTLIVSFCCAGTNVIIGVQPLGDVPEEFLHVIFQGIDSVYNTRVVFAWPIDMPSDAFYEPRARYRAEKLLDHLNACGDSACTKVVGITTHDISTTKEPYDDWGIFGLAGLGGFSCVVSTYRLGYGKVVQKKFNERLIKVINHELGHTFGLHHCLTKTCLMEDARGMMKTVDDETGVFCPQCRRFLSELLR
jgi:archaemetzincin